MHTWKSSFIPCPGILSFHWKLASVPCRKHCRLFTQEGTCRTMSWWWFLVFFILGKNSEEKCNAWVSLLSFLIWCSISPQKLQKLNCIMTNGMGDVKKKNKTPGPKPPKLEESELSSPSQRNCENYSSLLKRNSHWNANFDFDYLSRPALKFFRQK